MKAMTFAELMAVTEPLNSIQEMLTYDQLFRMSEPKRFKRSLTVKVPPLDLEQYQTGNHWVFAYYFNAKGNPSTTGLRHRGFVRFKKPKSSHRNKKTPLSQLPVEVDCECPDYKFRFSWSNHQRGAGPIGPNSLNQAINRAPRITNPKGVPGLCKHLLATRNYIYGLLSGFPKSVGPTDRLDKLTRHATRRWLNFDAEMEKARARDAKIAASKALRNIGKRPEEQNAPLQAPVGPEPPALPEPEEVLPPVTGPAETPLAPGAVVRPEKGLPPGKPLPKEPKGLNPNQFLGKRFLKVENVYKGTNMKTFTLQESTVIKNARKLVEDLEDSFEPGAAEELPPPSGATMPMEEPVSDTAVGASTEDNVALGLLREIRDLLTQIATEEEGEAPEIPGEEDEPETLESEEEETRGDEEDFRPGKRPMPVATGEE